MSRPPDRRAGVMAPLFSVPSSRSWGIGEIGDIPAVAAWLAAGGQRVWQLLPINETPLEETSPYSAMSAMAIDPQYLSMEAVEDLRALGGAAALGAGMLDELAAARASVVVQYRRVRALKAAALRLAFGRFAEQELATDTPRARAFRDFAAEAAWWLDDYALFRALHAAHGERPWTEWPEPLRRRDPDALGEARAGLAGEIALRQYGQWLADGQWREARAQAAERGVALFGDLPFMVALDSADVWARQDEFRLDVSVGVPPDAFSDTGQDWRLPAYDWPVLAARGYDWLRDRARSNTERFDCFRVDHLVGYYRTFFRPYDGGPAVFSPSEEPEQTAQGERVLEVFGSFGAEIIAEDLGTVPDFVRASLARLDIPGCKVMRWERAWHEPAQPFIDPAHYPARAMATSGTHDTEPLAVWWRELPRDERAAILDIPSVALALGDGDRIALIEGREPDQHDTARAAPSPVLAAMLQSLLGSAAELVILPIQDVFGLSDRINQPALVDDVNWTWRLPWASDALARETACVEAAARLREWSATRRVPQGIASEAS